jgi:hypothetical protein
MKLDRGNEGDESTVGREICLYDSPPPHKDLSLVKRTGVERCFRAPRKVEETSSKYK